MVPSYNYARYLRECVESAVTQDHVDVCIVENGSTDESPEIARELASQYDNVRLIEYPDNHGIITSLNRCRHAVIGEFSILLCADDCLTPGAVARAREVMEANPEVGMVYGPVTTFAERAEVQGEPWTRPSGEPQRRRGEDWVDEICRTGENPIRTPELMMRTTVNQQVGDLDPRCTHTSDLNLWLRIAAVSDVAFIPGPSQALYRVHDSMHSGNFPFFSPSDFRQRWMAFAAFLETVEDPSKRFRWEALARRALANDASYAATRLFVAPGVEDRERLAEELREFADELDPLRRHPLDDAAWALRRRLGPERSRRFPGFLPRAAWHRLTRLQSERREQRAGLR
jgi:glycosyltransferase involved in cell wall biosynthesis